MNGLGKPTNKRTADAVRAPKLTLPSITLPKEIIHTTSVYGRAVEVKVRAILPILGLILCASLLFDVLPTTIASAAVSTRRSRRVRGGSLLLRRDVLLALGTLLARGFVTCVAELDVVAAPFALFVARLKLLLALLLVDRKRPLEELAAANVTYDSPGPRHLPSCFWRMPAAL